MADIDLPVMSVRPNWSEPVTERLEWLTDVLTSRSGVEQRRSLRLSPRRFFVFKVNPTGNERSFLDQWLHRIGDEPCLLPLWHDQCRLDDAAAAASTRLTFPTTHHEFVEGGLALIYADALTFEVVEIGAIDATGIDLGAGLTSDWPTHTAVIPLRRAYLDPEVRMDNITSRVGDADLEFMIDGANDYDAGEEVLPLYDGHPVVSLGPNRLDDLEVRYQRTMGEFDSESGKIRRFDDTGRAFATQFYNWRAVGAEEHHKLRQTLYRLKGRLNPVWMPSFNDDVILARPLAAADTNLDIQKIGYALLGGVALGRKHLMLTDNARNSHMVEIDDTGDAQAAGEERLVLTAPADFDAAEGNAGGFADLVRMDQDTVEITHHGDAMGVCEVSAAFKSFRDTRSITGPLILTIPAAEMSDTNCGEPAEPSICNSEVATDWDLWFFWHLPAPDVPLYPSAHLRGARMRTRAINGNLGSIDFTPVPNAEYPRNWECKLKTGVGSVRFAGDLTQPAEWKHFHQWGYDAFSSGWLDAGHASYLYYKRPHFPDWSLLGVVRVKDHWPEWTTFWVP